MRTIGLLLGTTEDSYGRDLVRGALQSALVHKSRLLCLTSDRIGARRGAEAQHNVLYDLIDGRRIDGLVLAGSLSHDLGAAEMIKLCRRLNPLPIVTMAVELPTIPAVLTDNRRGFQAMMDHLIHVHHYTRLAWLGGPPDQQENEVRHSIFVDSLETAGLTLRPQWMVHGNFTNRSGYEATRRLLASQGHLPPAERWQALVAANDSMAIGALQALREAGWKVPEDCALTGFDDLPEGRILTPPITTVRQSVVDQAARAVDLLAGLWQGDVPTGPTILEPELVVRSSCGCQPTDWSQLDVAQVHSRAQALAQETRIAAEENAATGEKLNQLRLASESLLSGNSFRQFLTVLRDTLATMNYQGVWLALFENPQKPNLTSRLHLALPPGDPGQIFPQGLPFPSSELVPGNWDDFWGSSNLAVAEALYSREDRLGFLLFVTDLAGSQITGTLRSQISGALQAVLYLAERHAAEKKLIQSEKLAALGGLVAGVAHEINTPLGVAITASSFLVAQASLFVAKLETGPTSSDEIESFLLDVVQAGTSIENNLTRAAALVTSFKQVSSDQTSEERRVFTVKEYLEAVLISLRFQWKKRTIEVTLEGPDDLFIDSYPGALIQIVTNLIMNSLMHAFPDRQSGKIELVLEDRGTWAILLVRDNGRGILPEHQAKVFEPFFTTKRGQGGTGLGLPIVFNLVTNVMGGEITFHSEAGQGTTFEIRLAKKAP